MITRLSAAATVICALVGCSSSGGVRSHETFDVHGTVTLTGRIDLLAIAGGGKSSAAALLVDPDTHVCEGENGFDDVKEDAQVVIADDSGKTLGLGRLSPGSVPTKIKGIDTTCTFRMTVLKVPAGRKFYKITVGSRSGPQFTEQDLRDGPHLSLGG